MNDKRKTLKLMLSREARRKKFELTPKLNMPNDKRKTLKLMLSREARRKFFENHAVHAQMILALAWRSAYRRPCSNDPGFGLAKRLSPSMLK